MCHGNQANTLYLAVPARSCLLEAESCTRALAGERGTVACQRRDDIVAILMLPTARKEVPQRELAAADATVSNTAAKVSCAQDVNQAGFRAAR